jgi:hypothetical protein
MAQAKRERLRPQAKTLPQVMREFLTPEVFKQVRKAGPGRKQPRWDLHPLLYVLLLTTWCTGDSLPEKFEAAKGFYIVCCPKRCRPGKTFSGFEKALKRLPMPVLRALATALRGRILAVFDQRLFYGDWIPLGCDGTRQTCPRSEELERRLDCGLKAGAAPTVWNTSIVHLMLGIPWCWRFGRGGKASERAHLVQMISLLPAAALVVADAGYVGYELMRRLIERQVYFLIRMSSNATFYTDDAQPLEKFREGEVLYWPKKYQAQNNPPLRGRLLRVRSKKQQRDVWLFTNVADPARLSLAAAAQFYRWRWESEGFFRTYKRTLKKLKLESRTVKLIHRESEASMIATQLLLCQGALAMPAPRGAQKPVMCSPRGVLLEVRREIKTGWPRRDFAPRLARCQREQRRHRTTKKEKRPWPRRKPHQPPAAPQLLRLNKQLKHLLQQHIHAP